MGQGRPNLRWGGARALLAERGCPVELPDSQAPFCSLTRARGEESGGLVNQLQLLASRLQCILLVTGGRGGETRTGQ